MLHNPGKPVTIYEIARFIGSAYPRAMTPLNISAAFTKCGIFPFNKDVFTDEDFMPSSVTDRPAPVSQNQDSSHPNRAPLETCSSYDPDVTPDRESPSLLSQEQHSYDQDIR